MWIFFGSKYFFTKNKKTQKNLSKFPSRGFCKKKGGVKLAEEVGFEPTEGLHPQRFSRPPHSTTLPLFRRNAMYAIAPVFVKSKVRKIFSHI